MTGIFQRTVSKIMQEYQRSNGNLDHSNRFRPGRQKLKSVDNHRNESPTVEKVRAELRQSDSCKFSRSTTFKFMKALGFVFIERNDKLYICERPEIVARRRHYMQQIQKYRLENRNIVYI